MKAFYNVTQILSDYLKSNLSINSVKIGALSEIDLKKNRVYPLANIIVDRVSYGSATQIFDVRILFVDTVYEPQNDLEAETIPQIGNDNSHDVLNTMLSVANQLQTTMRLGELARNNFRLASEPTVEPFQDRFEDLVAGWVLNLSIEVPNVDVSSCDYVADIYLPPSLSDTYMKISTYDTNNDGRVDQLEETDPIFSASPASTITEEDIDNWNSSSAASGTSGYSGKSGYSGYSGINGESGLAGKNGAISEEWVWKEGIPVGDIDVGTFVTDSNRTIEVSSIQLSVTSNNGITVDSLLQNILENDYIQITRKDRISDYALFKILSSNLAGAFSVFYMGGDFVFSNNAIYVISFSKAGTSGYSGTDGTSGYSGKSGYSGVAGISGYSGATGVNYLFARVVGSNATTSSTSLVDVTGLTISVEANSVYEFEAQLSTASTTTAGCKYGIGCTQTAGASLECGIYGYYSTAAARAYRISAFATPVQVAMMTAAVDGTILIKGVIRTGNNAPTISVMFEKETAGTATVYVDSFLKMLKIG